MSSQPKTITTAQDIIDLRATLNLSRADFGALVGVYADAVGKWERGVTFPTKAKVQTLESIAQGKGRYAQDLNQEAKAAFWADRQEQGDVPVFDEQGRRVGSATMCGAQADLHLDDDVLTQSLTSISPAYAPEGKPWRNIGRRPQLLQDAGDRMTLPEYRDNMAHKPQQQREHDDLMRSLGREPVDVADVEHLHFKARMWQEVNSPEDTPNAQETTIDWQALVGEHQGIKGVSLRHLMSLGLYATYQRATEALDRAAVGFLPTSLKTITHTNTGGRPGEDTIITDLRLVQMFCVCAQTPLGVQIRDVVIAHHNELQAMLAGDEEAKARHEQAKTPPPAADPIDALAAMVNQLREQRDEIANQRAIQQQLEQRTMAVELKTEQVAQLARRLETTPLAGERSAYQIAEEAGIKSNAGRPHSSAVVALLLEMGLRKDGLAWQVPCEINGKLTDTWRVNSKGAARLKCEIAHLAKQGTVLEDGRTRFTIQGNTRQFTVYR